MGLQWWYSRPIVLSGLQPSLFQILLSNVSPPFEPHHLLNQRGSPAADTSESANASQEQVAGPSQSPGNGNGRGLSQGTRKGEVGGSHGTHQQGSGSAAAQQQEEADPVTEMLLAWEWGLSNDGLQEWSHSKCCQIPMSWYLKAGMSSSCAGCQHELSCAAEHHTHPPCPILGTASYLTILGILEILPLVIGTGMTQSLLDGFPSRDQITGEASCTPLGKCSTEETDLFPSCCREQGATWQFHAARSKSPCLSLLMPLSTHPTWSKCALSLMQSRQNGSVFPFPKDLSFFLILVLLYKSRLIPCPFACNSVSRLMPKGQGQGTGAQCNLNSDQGMRFLEQRVFPDSTEHKKERITSCTCLQEQLGKKGACYQTSPIRRTTVKGALVQRAGGLPDSTRERDARAAYHGCGPLPHKLVLRAAHCPPLACAQ
eukprot:1158095-Pelagomonas_calceolata.AAC.10